MSFGEKCTEHTENLFNFFASLKKLLSLSIIKVNFFLLRLIVIFPPITQIFWIFCHFFTFGSKTAGSDITIFHQDFVCTRHKPNKFGFCSRLSQNSLFDYVKLLRHDFVHARHNSSKLGSALAYHKIRSTDNTDTIRHFYIELTLIYMRYT